jgi:hypothetical protein
MLLSEFKFNTRLYIVNFFKLSNSKYFCFWFVSFYLLNFVSCINYGPVSLKSERSRYNLAIQKTNDEQLLLNLVRLKYRDTPFFMEVSNIASQFSLKSQASISAQLESIVEDIFNIGASASYVESPTVSYSPLQGDKFVKNILSTIPLKTIALLFHSGWSVERIFRVLFQTLNELENAPGASGPTPKLAPNYRAFQKAIHHLQELDNRDTLSIFYQEPDGQPQLVLKISNKDKNSKEAHAFARAMNVTPGQTKFILNYFPNPDQKKHIRITPRSFLGVMFYLSQSIEVPEQDVKNGKVTLTHDSNGDRFDWSNVTGDLLTIKFSKEKPFRSSTYISYRDTWFYIDDIDLESKSTFQLLMQIYSLQSGSIKSSEPILTIGVGRN